MITRILATYEGDLERPSGPQKALIRSPGYAPCRRRLEQLSLREKKVLLALRGERESTPQEVRDRGS